MKHAYSFSIGAPLVAGLLTLLPTWVVFAQGVGIGTSSPDASAVLAVRSTSQGLLPPRLSQA